MPPKECVTGADFIDDEAQCDDTELEEDSEEVADGFTAEEEEAIVALCEVNPTFRAFVLRTGMQALAMAGTLAGSLMLLRGRLGAVSGTPPGNTSQP